MAEQNLIEKEVSIENYPSEIHANLRSLLDFHDFPIDPNDYTSLRNTLGVEARQWRVFHKQVDALACAKRFSHLGMLPFVYHQCNGARRFFLVTHPLELWYQNQSRSQCYNYEIIMENTPSKLYLDLEYDRTVNPHHNGAKMTDTFNKILMYVLRKDYNINITTKHILNLDSTNNTKFSRHIIYQFPIPILFRNNIEAGNPVIKTCNFVRSMLKNISNYNDILKECHLNPCDVQELFVFDRGVESIFVDEGVYTRNRHFRLYKSTKFGRNAPLLLSPENAFETPFSHPKLNEEYIFLASLVTCHHSMQYTVPILTQASKPKIPKPIPKVTSKSNASQFTELNKFIELLIKPCTVDLVNNYNNGEFFVFVTKEPAFCANVGRQHSKGKVVYVIHVKKGIYYQKCLNPFCKTFRSKNAPLPNIVKKEFGFNLDSWDGVIIDCVSKIKI